MYKSDSTGLLDEFALAFALPHHFFVYPITSSFSSRRPLPLPFVFTFVISNEISFAYPFQCCQHFDILQVAAHLGHEADVEDTFSLSLASSRTAMDARSRGICVRSRA